MVCVLRKRVDDEVILMGCPAVEIEGETGGLRT